MTRRIRLLIPALMALLVALGAGFGLIRTAPEGLVRPGYSLTVLGLAIAAVAACVRPAPSRHFWFGYALLGAVYLAFHVGGEGQSFRSWQKYSAYENPIEPYEELEAVYNSPVTEIWVTSLTTWVVGSVPRQKAYSDEDAYRQAVTEWMRRCQSTWVFTHLVMVQAFGLLGAMLAVWWTPRGSPSSPTGKPRRPVRRGRVPIFALMALVGVLGVGFSLIRTAPEGWVRPAYSLTILALTLAGLAARVRPAPAGAFWVGYAVIGAVYLSLNLGGPDHVSRVWLKLSPYSSDMTPFDNGESYHVLLSEDWVGKFTGWVVRPESIATAAAAGPVGRELASLRHLRRSQNTLVYSHLLVVHTLGLLGGMLALWWTPRANPQPSPRETSA